MQQCGRMGWKMCRVTRFCEIMIPKSTAMLDAIADEQTNTCSHERARSLEICVLNLRFLCAWQTKVLVCHATRY
jgi:hypothetical protein